MPSNEHLRECRVVKDPEEAFEFFLKKGKYGQVISSVTPSGPADRAGLKNGDRIITVNGANVENEDHDHVVKLIQGCVPKNEITFEVISMEHEKENTAAKSNGDASTGPNVLRPRICKIAKRRQTFGFLLEVHGADKPGHFIKEVVDGGPAGESGLRERDRIIEVGGVNVEKMNHAKVVNQIKKQGNKVTLLVVDEATYRHFLARKKTIKAKHAYSSSDVVSERSTSSSSVRSSDKGKSPIKSASSSIFSDDPKARLLHIVKKPDGGYGFFLRVKKGEDGEYLGEVENDKPGQRCGVKENDRVIAVNGNLVFKTKHAEVVETIKKNPSHAVFLVVGPKAVENAKTYGLLSVVDDITKDLLEKPRSVEMRKDDGGYGFYLKLEKGNPNHIVTDVEANSAAEREGLKNDDVLICVGDACVLQTSHDDSVNLIKEAGDSVRLTVGNAKTASVLYDLGIEVNSEFLENWPTDQAFIIPGMSSYDDILNKDSPQQAEQKDAKPRLCVLTQIDGGFGFFLRDEGMHILGNIESRGAADVAGVLENDQIIEVNGVNVEKQNHDEVVERIKSSGDTVTFLVVNEEEKKFFDSRSIAITSALVVAATSHDSVESRPLPRYCELTKKDGTFGFHLNGENKSRPGQYIRRVVENGAADIAGLKNGDRVIEINDVNITEKIHEDVVKLIVASGSEVSFLVVDEEADLYYSEKKMKIIKSLVVSSVVTAAVVNEISDTHSNASSVVEAEATVHVEPEDEQDKTLPPIMVFPPPPEDDQEHDVAELIVEAIEEVREEERREEFVEELKEEIMEEVKEELKEEIREDVKEEILEQITEETKEEIIDEIREEVREEAEEEIREAIKQEIKEEVRDEIVEDLKEEIAEEIKDDIVEEVREDIKDAIMIGVAAKAVEEIREDIKEAAEEEAKEEAKEELLEELQDIKEEIQKESKEDEMERMKKEMREQIEREMKEKMEEEMRQKMAEAFPPPPAHLAPEPAKVIAAAVVANAVVNGETKKPFVRETPEDLTRAVGSLKSTKRYNDVQRDVEEEKKEENFKPTFMSARAMFENRQNQQSRPSWKRNTPASPVKNAVSAQVNDPKPPLVNGQDKPSVQQTSWTGNGMSFKIVETSSVFN